MSPPPSEAAEAPPRQEQPDGASPGAPPFDFRHPAPVAEARLAAVVAAHQRWALTLTALWAGVMPEEATIELTGAESVAVAELCPPEAPPCHAVVIPTGRRDAPVVFVVPVALAHVMVDRLLGGPGELADETRPVTEIESRLIADAMGTACTSLAELYELPPVPSFETCADLSLLALDATGAAALSIVITATIGDASAPVTIIVPAGSIGPITDALGGGAEEDEDNGTDPESRRRAISRLAEVPVEVEVRFTPSTIRSSEVLAMKVGDVVSLGTPPGGVLDLVIDGLRVAFVRPARNGEGLACQVVTALDAPEPVLPPAADSRPSRPHSGAS